MKTPLRLVITLTALSIAALTFAEEAKITVNADEALGPLSRYYTGACIEDVNHEIYGGIYSQMVFGESFQEPAPIPLIKGFKTLGGEWRVRDGAVEIHGDVGPKLVSNLPAFDDGSVGVEVYFADKNGANAGLIVHVSNAETGADSFTGYEVALDPGRGQLRLAQHRDNYELIQDIPCKIDAGRWIPLEVKLAGSVIEILVDGKSVLRHDDGAKALPAGTVGLRVWQREAKFRNLWVRTGSQAEPLPFVCDLATTPEISRMWRAVHVGSAAGKYAIVSEKPFVGTQSQQVTFESGEGEIGIENQGLNRWGMGFVAGKPYEGYVWVRAENPVTLYASLESRDGAKQYAETPLRVAAGDWQRVDFTLSPNMADKSGRFALKLKQPGTITVGHAFLQPGEWGRFKGLPVRRDVAEGLIGQGITVLRYGGSMINHPEYKWKKMIGPRDRRPPYTGLWYKYSTNGWAIPDFMNFCEAAGFLYIPDFNVNETPADMADFIDYAKAPTDSEWGRRRAADGHPEPYRLPFIQLGNEESVNDAYADKFEKLAEAIWAKDPKVTLVVGDFCYERHIDDPFHFSGAAGGITSLAAQQRILKLAKQHDREVWFDVHVGTEWAERFNRSLDGMFSYVDALEKIAEGARFKVAVFELNAGNHAQKRALANAQALIAAEHDGRLPIVTSANCLQPDGQNDNDWNQGLLFLNPAQVWLQPPGYVTQMMSQNYLPKRVRCSANGGDGLFDASAKRSDDGKTLVLQVVNASANAIDAKLEVTGFTPSKATAQVTELSAPWEAVNTVERPDAVTPKKGEWKHQFANGAATYGFPPMSFTVIRLE
jgi:hypothetical protein